MKKVVFREEMQNIDSKTINEIGIKGEVLMGYAGYRTFLYIEEFLGNRGFKKDRVRFLVISGKGNNGGDGFVVAYHLHNNGYKVKLAIIPDESEIKGDSRFHFDIVKKLNIPLYRLTEDSLSLLEEDIRNSDIVVDAILGTGIKGEPRGIYRDIITLVNRYSKSVVSIDVPSGLLVNGEYSDPELVVRADMTVTMGAYKVGLILYPGREFCGDLKIAHIGFPKEFIDFNDDLKGHILEPCDIKPFFSKRDPDTHKGSYGHLLVVGGSPGLMGAPVMSSAASYEVGAGLVSVLVPNVMVEKEVPFEVMLYHGDSEYLSVNDLKKVEHILDRINSFVLGPGIGRREETKSLVNELLEIAKDRDIPIVIDADGLYHLDKKALFPKAILTPHIGEFSRLIGVPVSQIKNNPLEYALEFATGEGIILHLKFSSSITVYPDGRFFINTTGNPGMAAGGTGDVLSGIIGGLLAQYGFVEGIVEASAFILGLAGDLWVEKNNEYSLTASKILLSLKEAIGYIINYNC